jgi:hypothetical protein
MGSLSQELYFVVKGVNDKAVSGDWKHVAKFLCLLGGALDEGRSVLGRRKGGYHGRAAVNGDGTSRVGSLEKKIPCIWRETTDKEDMGSGAVTSFGIVGTVEVGRANTVEFYEGEEIRGNDFAEVGGREVWLQMEEENAEDVEATLTGGTKK